MQIKYVSSKTSKKQIFDGCVTKLYKNQLQKTFRNLSYLFYKNFFATFFKQTLFKR